MNNVFDAAALRDSYKATWSRDWPEDDTYLGELMLESDTAEDCLTLMRENHEF